MAKKTTEEIIDVKSTPVAVTEVAPVEVAPKAPFAAEFSNYEDGIVTIRIREDILSNVALFLTNATPGLANAGAYVESLNIMVRLAEFIQQAQEQAKPKEEATE